MDKVERGEVDYMEILEQIYREVMRIGENF